MSFSHYYWFINPLKYGGKNGQIYLHDFLSMCDLLLKGSVHVVYFFSTDNFDQNRFLETIFEWRIKVKVSTKCIYKYVRFVLGYSIIYKYVNIYK